MIDYLHPSGWFISSICEVAKELNVEISIVEKILSKDVNLKNINNSLILKTLRNNIQKKDIWEYIS